MGNNLSTQVTAWLMPHHWRQDEPDCFEPYKYDPQFGFKEPRPLKENRATEQMMDSANINERDRNFCTLERMHLRGCLKDNNPLVFRCKGFFNEVHLCELEERFHDMKEFEREKRLNARERKLREAAQASG